MLKILPMLLFALVISATLLRGRAVRARSGISAWAFAGAKGRQRLAAGAFTLSIGALVLAALLLALGHIVAEPATLIVGSAAMATGTLIVVVAQIQMGNAWRVGVREGDAPLFVTAGLFRVSRNPIFLGMVLMSLGAALAIGTIWGWLAAAAFALACHAQIRIEEAHLARQFGASYDDFQKRVPRWLFV